jgi:2-oxoisovalerate dehydrogenase E1 component beta subunit
MTSVATGAAGGVTYLEAIARGLREEMARDRSVFLLGEDIATYGGAFKVTRGFVEEFGPARVLDTPLAESGIVGVAVGAALMGMRPVVEMQFADFVACCVNQIVNNAAKCHHRWGAPVPLVVRLPSGGNVHGGPFHSTNPEAWFAHVPGLKVVAPATPADALGLIKAAIRDPNPVIYMESKYLYRRIKGPLPESDHVVAIGCADVKREGHDASVIAYGSATHMALEAAGTLAAEGRSVEVLDLRSLVPYDRDAIARTVRRTGRVLIVHEDTLTGGFGAEIAAFVASELFEHLDAPVRRLAGLDTPVPYSPPMEEFFQISTPKVLSALRELLAY